MTHPHGLTRADVAHLKAGDEVTAVLSVFRDGKFRVTSELTAHRAGDSTLKLAGWNVICQGEPLSALVEVISPKPPTPPMAEPTWLGAVVMTDDGPAVRAPGKFSPFWEVNSCVWNWESMLQELHPRPLTDAERRDLGIPETLPDGWVAVDAGDIDRDHLGSWMSDHWPDDLHIGLVQDVARAELARREATK